MRAWPLEVLEANVGGFLCLSWTCATAVEHRVASKDVRYVWPGERWFLSAAALEAAAL